MAVLPPAPNWFSAQILRCSGRGQLAFGARHAVVILQCRPESHFCLSEAIEHRGEGARSSGSSEWRRSASALSIGDRIHPDANILTTVFSEKAKVTSVCWSPDSTRMVAASDDGHVKVLRVDEDLTVICTQMHAFHRELSRDRHKVNTVCWSKPNPDLIISGDEMGNMVLWDVKNNTTRNVNVGKNNIFVLETHPFKEDIVAFGCRLGLVFVVNTSGNGKVLQKIRGHDEDIQGLSWSPSKKRDVLLDPRTSASSGAGDADQDQTTEEESLLAISSREKILTIWSSKTGRQLALLKLPGTNNPGGGKAKQDTKMSWTTCFWWKREILLSSGAHGELLEWNLDRLTQRTPNGVLRGDGHQSECQVLHREHARTLYSIHTTGASIQSSGQDRAIISFHWDSHTLDFNLPAFAAWVYAIAPNPQDCRVLAIGAGDGQIRVWKINSAKAMFDVNTIWQKLNSAKVTALSWHPDKESILAFGTDEGRVGVLDVLSNRCVPSFCDFKHRSTVYNLCWGPKVIGGGGTGASSGDHKDTKKLLYSCGDGSVMMHSAKQEGSKTVNVEEIISHTNGFNRKLPGRSDILFQPHEYKYMVLGTEEGTVEIFLMPRLQLICSLKSFSRLIQSLAWHPLFTGNSDKASPYKNWLAIASNEQDIHVWDISHVLPASWTGEESSTAPGGVQTDTLNSSVNSEKGDDLPILTQPTQILSGHHQRVIFLNWSPHEDAKLLSVSYDCTAQVWDVSKNSPVCNFSGHTGRLFCGVWNPLEPDMIFTGGEDSTVFGWKISQQTNTLPLKKPMKKTVLIKKSKDKETSKEGGNCQHDINDALALLEAKRREIMMEDEDIVSNKSSDSLLDSSECREAIMQPESKPLSGKRKQKKRAYFPLSFQRENASKANAPDDCQMLYTFLFEEGNDDNKPVDTSVERLSSQNRMVFDRPHLGFFIDKFGMDNLLDMEVKHMQSQGQDELASHLRLWSGDLGETIKTILRTGGRLNDWLVSMSAGISYPLWKEACAAYANQLIKDDEIVKGASYYLMMHQLPEAIEALRKNHFYRAAVAIAKSRLPHDAKLLQELYTSWAFQASNDGSFELAAKCWIAAGELSQAASLLAKRGDPSSLRVASLLAVKGGELEKCRVLAAQCATQCVKACDWKCMETLATQVNLPNIQSMWEEARRNRRDIMDVEASADTAILDQLPIRPKKTSSCGAGISVIVKNNSTEVAPVDAESKDLNVATEIDQGDVEKEKKFNVEEEVHVENDEEL